MNLGFLAAACVEEMAVVIRSIEINWFRGIRKGRLDNLTPLVILVGPNGSGKSTVLEALFLGADPYWVRALKMLASRRCELDRGARWLMWRGNTEQSARLEVTTNREQRVSCLKLVDSGATVRFEFKHQKSDSSEKKSIAAFSDKGRLDHHSGPESVEPLQDISEVRFIDLPSSEHDQSLVQLYTAAVEQGRREEIIRLLAELLPSTKSLEILAPDGQPVLYIGFEDRSVPAALAGDGIRLVLRLALTLATRKEGLVLIEEPEVHLHPGAIWQAARVIVVAMRRGVQIVLTTHSLELIDALVAACSADDLEKLSVCRLRLDEGVLKSSCLAGPDVALARDGIEDDLR